MVRAWHAANVAACCAVFEPRVVRDFQRSVMFLPPEYWVIVSMLCSWTRHFIPSHVSLDSGVIEYLVRQRWQCVRYVQCAEMAAGLYALRGVEMAQARTGPVTRK